MLNLTDGDQTGADNIMRFFNLNLWFNSILKTSKSGVFSISDNSLTSLVVQVLEQVVDNFCFHLSPVQIPVGVKVLSKFERLILLETAADACSFDLNCVRRFIRVKGASEIQFLEIF